MNDLKLADGRARVVRHGYRPARTIATGIGPVEIARAKIAFLQPFSTVFPLRCRSAARRSSRVSPLNQPLRVSARLLEITRFALPDKADTLVTSLKPQSWPPLPFAKTSQLW